VNNKIVTLTGIKKEIINEIGIYNFFNNTEQLKLHKVTDIQYNKAIQLKELIQGYLESSTLQEKIIGSSSRESGEYLVKYFKTLHDKEYFVMVCLNTSNEITAIKVLASGSIAECIIHRRELIKIALFENACNVILAHNHPAGKLKPSNNDLQLHEDMKQALKTVSIGYIDNMIITFDKYYSFVEQGLF